MSERLIFGKPIRESTTLEFFPDKMSIDEFKYTVVNSFDDYKANMDDLGEVANKPKYIEEWVEQYLAWLEIEEER